MEELSIEALKLKYETTKINNHRAVKVGMDYYALEEACAGDGIIDEDYLYFCELPEKTQCSYLVHRLNKNRSISKLRMQIKVPKFLCDEQIVLVGRKLDSFGIPSQNSSIITKKGIYNLSNKEIVEVVSHRVAIVEKELSKNKIGFYLKDLKDGEVIEEVIPTPYMPGRRINSLRQLDREKNETITYICVGHPDHPLYPGYKHELSKFHKILLDKDYYMKR